MKFTEPYHQLTLYTLAHPDQEYFIHQHVVDAQTAQTADASTKCLSLVYSLVGLYLAVEKGYTGRQVQDAHAMLAKNKQGLPHITLPQERGVVTAIDVLQTEPGGERDNMIKRWCDSVWQAYAASHNIIVTYCANQQLICEVN